MPVRRTISRLATVVLAALATVTVVSESAHAQARQSKHCRVVIEPLEPGEKFSKVRSRTCSDRQEDLRVNAGTLLITWYEHTSWGGMSTAVEGSSGPCDYEGYGIRDTGGLGDPWRPYWWRDNISSFKVWNQCWIVTSYPEVNYGGASGVGNGYWGGNQSQLGGANDQVRSLRLQG